MYVGGVQIATILLRHIIILILYYTYVQQTAYLGTYLLPASLTCYRFYLFEACKVLFKYYMVYVFFFLNSGYQSTIIISDFHMNKKYFKKLGRYRLAVIFLVILQNYFVIYSFYRLVSLGSDPQISRVLMSSTIDGITFT